MALADLTHASAAWLADSYTIGCASDLDGAKHTGPLLHVIHTGPGLRRSKAVYRYRTLVIGEALCGQCDQPRDLCGCDPADMASAPAMRVAA